MSDVNVTSLRCHEWDIHQSYRRDRNPPPWIKVHRNIMQNRKWARLSDAEKGQLISIWVLAADRDGQVPNDPFLLKKICMLDSEPNISRFIELGLLIPDGRHRDVNVTSTGRQSDAPEAEPDKNKKKTTSTAARFDAFWTAYPKKVEKKKALEIWKRRKLDSLADSLIADVRGRMERDRKWIDGYIPNPTTYLNGDRWEDEMGAAALSLPKDPKALFAIRRAIGLPFEFDEVKSCHAEIQGAVRADPAKRQAVEALL